MKITKKRLKEIVVEELKKALAAPEDEKHTRATAVAGAKEMGTQGAAGLGRQASALSPGEGRAASIGQALNQELVKDDEIPGITTVIRLLQTALAKARGQ